MDALDKRMINLAVQDALSIAKHFRSDLSEEKFKKKLTNCMQDMYSKSISDDKLPDLINKVLGALKEVDFK